LSALWLRARLAALTGALERAERDDVVLLDPLAGVAHVDSALDDVDDRVARGRDVAVAVARPDGLWEWEVRRDFVRSVRALAPVDARRLGTTLRGARTKRRFELALGLVKDRSLLRAFALFRRRRLRGWAARLLRALLAGHPVSAAERASVSGPSKKKPKKARSRRPPRRRRRQFVPYIS